MFGSGRRAARVAVVMAVASMVPIVAATPEAAQANSAPHDEMVTDDPVDYTPHVLDGRVYAITTVGDKVIVGGTFTQVKQVGDPTVYARNKIFAFDKLTGALDTSFVPTLDDDVWTLDAAGDGTSVFVGGKFATVNTVSNFGITKLNTLDGSMVPGFTATTAGKVRDLVYHGGKVYLGGDIWSVNGQVRERIAAIDATTGALDSTFAIGPTLPRVSVTWVSKLDINPDGSTLMVMGNFNEFDNQPRQQMAMLDLEGPTATVANWQTDRFNPTCASVFWTYLRDVEHSPDGEYFVVATTGAHAAGVPDLCDAASRWETDDRGTGLLESWADWSGFDTLTALAISNVAIYIGGHMKYMNGCEGSGAKCNGAVDRPGIAALDPINGLPFTWNPTKGRGVAVWDLHLSDEGLYVGSDEDFAGGEYHAKLAQFPRGGIVPPMPTPATLPTNLYSGNDGDGTLTTRAYDGVTLGSDSAIAGNTVNWSTVGGTFAQADRLYTLETNTGDLTSRSFDGANMGPTIDHNSWVNWASVTAAAWDNGRLYYTVSGNSRLYYRYFSLESGIVSSQRTTISGAGVDTLNWSAVRGLAFAGNELYYSDTAGNLRSIDMLDGAPVSGTEVLLSGPGVDGRNWAGADLFFYQPDADPIVTIANPLDGDVVTGNSVNVVATATDDFGVDQVEFLVDGVSIAVDTDGADGWGAVWDPATAATSPVTLEAIATDTTGQTGSEAVSIAIDGASPVITLDAPLDNAVLAGTVALSATATDDVAVTSVDFRVDGNSIGIDTDGTDGWSLAWDTTTHADGAATVEAIATDPVGNSASDSAAITIENATVGVVVIVAGSTTLNAGDTAVADRLAGLGYTVSVVDDDVVTAGAAAGASLVIVSSTANSFKVGASLNGVAEPVWVAKPWSFDDLGLTGPGGFGLTTASSVTIDDPGSALAAGLSGTVAFTTNNKSYTRGVPAAAADVIFSVAGGDPSMFVYEAGDTLADNSVAAGCRLAFPIFQTGPTAFTSDAWVLFDATASYAANGCVVPPPNSPPTLTVTNPADAALVTGVVNITATASDDQGVSQVEFFVGGNSVGVDSNGADGYSAAVDTTTLADGVHAIAVTATDITNLTTTVNLSVTVDNNAPVVAITAPANGGIVAGTIPISATATDGNGISQVEFFVGGNSVGVDTDGTDGFGLAWDSTTVADGVVTISATATDGAAMTASDSVGVTVDNTAAGVVLFVVEDTNLTAGESAVKARMESLGYTVNVVDDNVAVVGDATGASFVVLSATSNSNLVGSMFDDVTNPVWTAKPYSLDDMGMTGPVAGTDYGTTGTNSVTILDAAHPLAAGLSGSVAFTTATKTVSFGVPGAAANAIAETSNGRDTIFAYDAGDLLADGSTAAGCRVTFPIFSNGPTFFTADAWSMFDATVGYLTADCA